MSDSANLWTVPHRDSSVQGILRQEHWSGLPFPPLGDYTDAGVDLLHWQADSFTTEQLGKPDHM